MSRHLSNSRRDAVTPATEEFCSRRVRQLFLAASMWTSRIRSFHRSAILPGCGNSPVSKLPIQYSARTTTGTSISYMQMELAHRDGVLIPEQKAEPEDPKQPDELLAADRGGLVFVPKLGFA